MNIKNLSKKDFRELYLSSNGKRVELTDFDFVTLDDNSYRELVELQGFNYDEIKEKSHDVAWRSTARDFSISWDNIACEAGLDKEELECLNEFSKMTAALN